MPCGSRSRRNRRHRQQHKRLPCVNTPPHDDEALAEVVEEESSAANTEEVARTNSPREETKIDGDTLNITTEKMCAEELPYFENMSSARSRTLRKNNRFKIEKKTLQTDTQICEITTIRNAVPLEARLDHIAGVGIVEAGLNDKENSSQSMQPSNVTVSEPAEPLKPLSKDLAEKVENFPGVKECWTVAIPTKRFDFLEIHEMSESEAEFDSASPRPPTHAIVSEAESDVERESSVDRLKDISSSSDDESMPYEVEKKLRNFIEGLKLPSSSSTSDAASRVPDAQRRKRASVPLGSQLSQEQNRCLDIIEEEGETQSGEDGGGKQHIRDFINEEIGKFHRPRRDLRSVLRDERRSAEFDDEQTEDIGRAGQVDETRLIASAAVPSNEVSKKDAGSKQGCDTSSVDDVKVKEIVVVPATTETDKGMKIEEAEKITVPEKESTIENTFSQSENVVTFMNLVHSLTESVINDKTSKRVTLGEVRPNLKEIEEHVAEKSVIIDIEANDGTGNIVKIEKDGPCTNDANISAKETSKCGKLEPSKETLELENPVEEDVTQDKNNEVDSDGGLKEIVIHSPLQYNSDNKKAKITNEIIESHDANDINNKAEIIDQTKLRRTDAIRASGAVESPSSISKENEKVNDVPVLQTAQEIPNKSKPVDQNEENSQKVSENVQSKGNIDNVLVERVQNEQTCNNVIEMSKVKIKNENLDVREMDGDVPTKVEAATEYIAAPTVQDISQSEVDRILELNNHYNNPTKCSLPPWVKDFGKHTIPVQLENIALLIAETENNMVHDNDTKINLARVENLESNGNSDKVKSEQKVIPINSIGTCNANGISGDVVRELKDQIENTYKDIDPLEEQTNGKSDINKNSLEINSARVIPVQLEKTLHNKKDDKIEDSESTEKRKEGEERIVPIQLDSKIYKRLHGAQVDEELNKKIKERISPVQSEDWTINIERDKIQVPERSAARNRSRERLVPIKLENNGRVNGESIGKSDVRVIPVQLGEYVVPISVENTLRWQSFKNTLHIDRSLLQNAATRDAEKNIFINRAAPPPPARSQRLMLIPNSRSCADYIPFGSNQFARLQHRAADVIERSHNNNCETAELVKALLTLLSSHASTREDVRNLLVRYDLESLPQNIRGIIDELLAPPSPPRARLRKHAHKIGSGASFEIASPRKRFTHSQEEVGETPPPRPAPPRTTIQFADAGRTTGRSPLLGHRNESRTIIGTAPGAEENYDDDDDDNETIARRNEHLYYVPLGRANNSRDYAAPAKFSDTLKDLCIKKILSMPRGEALIREIAFPRGPWHANAGDYLRRSRANETKHRDKMGNQKSKCWTGVPTKDNPKVLVCFSPAQRESDIKTSPDNLLDLHKKFVDRHGYYHEHPRPVDPSKFYVDVSPIHEDGAAMDEGPSRLLSIIKENPVPRQTNGMVDRLQAKRLSDWLSMARRPEGDNAAEWPDGLSADDNQPLAHSTPPPLSRNPTPNLRKSPISFNSAIIDKSAARASSPLPPRSASAMSQRDAHYVNSALIIEDKPQVPSPVKRVVTVDPDCIDTRSIFEQGSYTPRSSRSSSRVGLNSDSPEQVVASEILGNLKQLQTGMKEQMDKRKRYSLPQEYFERQLKYIERLEHQLKNVIVAEEEEKRAAKQFQQELDARKMLQRKPRPFTIAECSFLDNPAKRVQLQQNGTTAHEAQSWKDSSEKIEANSAEYESKEGSREMKSQVKSENGVYSETSSTETIERREQRTFSNSATDESKLKDFFRYINEPTPTSEDRTKKSSKQSATKKQQQQRPISIAAIPTNGEVFRQQMYDEYVNKVHEREERRQHKLIKISSHADLPSKHHRDSLTTVEQEFIEKAKNRLHKHGIKLDDSETEGGGGSGSSGGETISAKFLVDGQEVKDARNLPKHLQEFLRLSSCEDDEEAARDNSHSKGAKSRADNASDLLHEIDGALKLSKGFLLGGEMIAPTFKASSAKPGVWSPGSGSSESAKPPRQPSPERAKDSKDDPIPPVWTPSSAGPSPVPERKEFRPVSFESPVLSRKKIAQPQPSKTDNSPAAAPASSSWQKEQHKKESTQVLSQSSSSSNIPSSRIVNSYSAPTQGLNTLAGAPRLPRAQNPTITLLQKAREGQLPKGAAYLDETDHIPRSKAEEKPLLSPGEVIYTLKKEYESEPENEYVPPKKMADLGPRKYEGIGPTTRHGMPLVLRSEVKEGNQERWYKQMYNSLHRAPRKDDYVTIRYKPHRGTRTGYSGTSSGYLSEPEPGRSSYTERSATLDGRRHRQRSKENDFSTLPRPSGRVDGHYSPDTYHMNPGRIENYEPGNCSIQEKETKEPPSDLTWAKRKWWDEVMDIFDGWLDENGRPDPRQQQQQQASPQPQHQPEAMASPAAQQLLHRTRSLLSHNVRQQQQQQQPRDRPLRGSSPLNRLYSERRELELRQLRLLESLLELNRDSQQVQEIAASGRPRSGSTSSAGRNIIRPLDWHQPVVARQPASQSMLQQQQQPLSSSASSSSSVTNSSSNGTSTNHAAVAPSSSTSSPRLPFEQSNSPKSYMTHALKESGYESDSTLVFRRREDVSPLSPLEQRIAYKTVQKGGDVPLHGLRKPAPERPKDDTEIEYFPISPTLTRIRVHRKSSCSSATASPASSTSSMNVSRIPVSSMASRRAHSRGTSQNPPAAASSSSLSRKANGASTVPSPPKRKSSRNNRTLKLYSTAAPDLHQPERHEQCFVEEHISNIRLLKEKLNSNLEKHRREREESQKQRLARTLSASPVPLLRRPISAGSLDSKKRRSEPCLARSPGDSVVKARLSVSTSPVARSPRVPLLRKTAEIKSTLNRSSSRTSLSSSAKDLRACQHASRAKIASSPAKKETKLRKSKKEQEESSKRLSRSAVDLTSSVQEVRRTLPKQKEKDRHPRAVTTRILPSGTVVKSSSAPYVSSITGSRLRLDDKGLKVTVAISQRGREIFRKPTTLGRTVSSLKQKSCSIDSGSEAKKRKVRDKSPSVKKSDSRQSLIDQSKMSKSTEMKGRRKESSRNTAKSTCLERSQSERMTKSDISSPALTIEMLRQHHEATMSDSFFQHLFLRDIMLTSTQTNPARKSSVLERARMFQEINYSDSYKSEPSLKGLSSYLAHKRPVSNSRFKNWERESMSSRSSSPYGMRSSLSRFHNKYDSLLRVDEFGSSSSLRGRSPDLTRECPKERSLSEPPLKTLRESPDSAGRRSPSPSPVRSPSSRKIQTLRQDHTADESALKKSRAKSASEMDSIYGYKQTFGSNTSLTRSTNSLMNFPVDRENYQQYILERLHSRQKSKRYRDLYDFYTSLERMGTLEKTTSSGDLRPRLRNEEVIDYERWKQLRAKEKAEQELKNLYKKLKMAQKEKDFLFIASDVDRYRWRGDCSLRCKERSVENIKEQFRKLENQESDLEASRQREIAAKKDTYKPLWRGNSVVNVATTMTRKAAEKAEFDRSSVQASLQKSLGGSNKFWSSLSVEQVTALKNQLNDIYGSDLPQPKKFKPKSPPRPISDVPLQNGAMEPEKPIRRQSPVAQADIKKDALISDSEQSSLTVSDYEIVVPMKKRDISPEGLHVRCHSMITPDRRSRRSDETDAMKRSGSISRVSSLERSNSDRAPSSSPMSEVEKKRLSLTLGKEMLEKVSQRLKASMIKPRETRGALAAVLAKSSSNVSPRTCSSIDAPTSDDAAKSKADRDYVLVLTPTEGGREQKERVERVMKEWSKKPPIVTVSPPEGIDQLDSATESSDTSVKTVVQRSSDCDELQRKVEFYETIDKQKEDEASKSAPRRQACKLSSAQSFGDLKELFGESAAAKYRTVPLFRSRSSSPSGKAERASGSPDVVASTRRERPRSASPCRAASPAAISESSSLESLWQRCGSPDPEKYWRTYLKLVRDGTVRRLRAKFESLEELSHSRRRLALIPKRFQSDPELARNLLKKVTDTTKNYIKPQEIPDVAWLRRKYEPPRGRRRRGGVSPIPRVPWKLEDLTMPHINVISKTAELKESSNRKHSTSVPLKEETKELKAKRAVNRVREMFERSLSPESKTSLLGEMFTSAPNVHELRDIAPYLAGRWVAHQYPSRYDNSRSLSSPPDLSRDSETSSLKSKGSITPPSRKKKFAGSSRASSTSPVRPRTPVSILKPPQQPEPKQTKTDVFANQPFDPSKHRPRYRYQPTPPPLPQPPSPKSRYKGIRQQWCPPMPTYNARPTVVTFESPGTRPPKAYHRV